MNGAVGWMEGNGRGMRRTDSPSPPPPFRCRRRTKRGKARQAQEVRNEMTNGGRRARYIYNVLYMGGSKGRQKDRRHKQWGVKGTPDRVVAQRAIWGLRNRVAGRWRRAFMAAARGRGGGREGGGDGDGGGTER
ncbi:hypothetical protein GPALN_003031 [Globodera pallida]|nr:hypothetical protein GPALN_003031 [Globodera pallida]